MEPVEIWRDSLRFFLPELTLAAGLLLVILADLVFRRDRGIAAKVLTVLTLAGAAFLACLNPLVLREGLFPSIGPEAGMLGTFSGLLAYDAMAVFFRILLPLVTLLAVVASFYSRELRGLRTGEFLTLMLAATLGMVLLAESQNLLMVFLSLELVSIPSYVLVAYLRRERAGAEAALKYVLVGAICTGTMLYGITLLYGMTGSYDFQGIRTFLGNVSLAGVDRWTFLVAGLLALAGFGFKVAAVPFHFWAPDVYTGAPTPVTAFLTVGPKAAGFAAILRFFLMGTAGAENRLMATTGVDWPTLVAAVAVMTMTLGNLAAFFQSDMKRLLGYSSIAHAGYMLMGVVVLGRMDPASGALYFPGVKAILLYLVVYALMNVGAFLVVILVHERTGSVEISSLAGLGRSSPFLALAMAVFVFSLMGIPPLAGFWPKWYLLLAVIREGWYVLAGIAALNFVFGLFYYARILKAMYMESPPLRQPAGEPGALLPAVVPLTIRRLAFLLVLAVPNLFFLWPLWGPLDRLTTLSAHLLLPGN